MSLYRPIPTVASSSQDLALIQVPKEEQSPVTGAGFYGIARSIPLLTKIEVRREFHVTLTKFEWVTGFPAKTPFTVDEYRFKSRRRLEPYTEEITDQAVTIWFQWEKELEAGEIIAVATPYPPV